jgi:hypothetical protein
MKRLVLPAICVALALSGCSPDGDAGVSRFVDPARYGSLLPESAPSVLLPPEESAKAKNNVGGVTESKAFTVDMQWEISGGRFISEEFSFNLHPQWRERFKMQPGEISSGSLNFRTFDFYFVEAETGIELELLRINVFRSPDQTTVELMRGVELGRSSDDAYIYARMPVSVDPPEEFLSRTELYDILVMIYSDAAESLDFAVLV